VVEAYLEGSLTHPTRHQFVQEMIYFTIGRFHSIYT
jgi:hypothetical protein